MDHETDPVLQVIPQIEHRFCGEDVRLLAGRYRVLERAILLLDNLDHGRSSVLNYPKKLELSCVSPARTQQRQETELVERFPKSGSIHRPLTVAGVNGSTRSAAVE